MSGARAAESPSAWRRSSIPYSVRTSACHADMRVGFRQHARLPEPDLGSTVLAAAELQPISKRAGAR